MKTAPLLIVCALAFFWNASPVFADITRSNHASAKPGFIHSIRMARSIWKARKVQPKGNSNTRGNIFAVLALFLGIAGAWVGLIASSSYITATMITLGILALLADLASFLLGILVVGNRESCKDAKIISWIAFCFDLIDPLIIGFGIMIWLLLLFFHG